MKKLLSILFLFSVLNLTKAQTYSYLNVNSAAGVPVAILNVNTYFINLLNPAGVWALHGNNDFNWVVSPGTFLTNGFSDQMYSTAWADTSIEKFLVRVAFSYNIGSVHYTNWSGSFRPGGSATVTLTAGNPPIVTTNYYMNLTNSYAYPAKATWTMNGVVVKSETLPVGGVDGWLSPDIRVSPVPDTVSLNASISVLPTIGLGGDGSPIFSSLGSGSGSIVGSGGTFTSSGGGSTNSGVTYTANNTGGTYTASTNSPIIWQASVGAASESTLKAGFNQTVLRLGDVVAGESILNNQLLTMTNQLGQVITLLQSNQLVDGMWLPMIVGAITNSPGGSSSSNVFVMNWPSNSTLSLSNYATETTMVGISNLLAATNSAGTNFVQAAYDAAAAVIRALIPASATNASAAEAAADAAQGDYGVNGLISQLTPSLPDDSYGAPDMTMEFCGRTIDFDPVHQFPSLSNFALTGFKIMLILAFLIDIGAMYWKLIQIRASTSTGGVPDLEVFAGAEGFTFGGQLGGNAIGIVVAILIPAAFIALFTVGMNYLFAHLGVSISDAMDISGWLSSAPGMAVYLLTSFFPVRLFFSLLTTRITLTFTLGRIVALATAAARWLWGK